MGPCCFRYGSRKHFQWTWLELLAACPRAIPSSTSLPPESAEKALIARRRRRVTTVEDSRGELSCKDSQTAAALMSLWLTVL